MPVPRITPAELQGLLSAGGDDAPLVLDARLKYPYEHSTVRIPGSVRHQAGAALPAVRLVVVYDSDPDELVSSAVAATLIRLHQRASALAGGIAAWLAAGLPIEAKDAPRPAAPAASLKA